MRCGIVMPLGNLSGGAESALVQLLEAHPREHSLQYYLCFLEDGPLVGQCRNLGYEVLVVPAGRLRNPLQGLRCVLTILHWIRMRELDVVLSWMAKAHLYAGPAAWWSRVRAMWWQHGLPSAGMVDRVASIIPAATVLACSNAVRNRQQESSGRATKVVTVYPPVDVGKLTRPYLNEVSAIRQRLGLRPNKIVIGFVGRLQRWKGAHVLLDAAAAIIGKGYDPTFVIVGGEHRFETDYAESLRTQANRLAIEDNVVFAGHCDNVEEWMAAMDIVVNASCWEPFGMVIAEAMVLGKAVVATNVAGPLEIVSNDADGVLIRPNDASELARVLEELMTNAHRRQKLGKAAKIRAMRFDKITFSQVVAESVMDDSTR